MHLEGSPGQSLVCVVPYLSSHQNCIEKLLVRGEVLIVESRGVMALFSLCDRELLWSTNLINFRLMNSHSDAGLRSISKACLLPGEELVQIFFLNEDGLITYYDLDSDTRYPIVFPSSAHYDARSEHVTLPATIGLMCLSVAGGATQLFVLPAERGDARASQIQKWNLELEDGSSSVDSSFQCSEDLAVCFMTSVGGHLFIASASSAAQIDEQGSVTRIFHTSNNLSTRVDCVVLHEGFLILGSGTEVTSFAAFPFFWSKSEHYKFPDRSRSSFICFVLLQQKHLRGRRCTWPCEQIVNELVMDGISVRLWHAE